MESKVSRQQRKEELRAFDADQRWVEENREALLSRYPNQWIAVKQGQVVASESEFHELLEKIEDPGHTYVVYITAEPLEMVL